MNPTSTAPPPIPDRPVPVFVAQGTTRTVDEVVQWLADRATLRSGDLSDEHSAGLEPQVTRLSAASPAVGELVTLALPLPHAGWGTSDNRTLADALSERHSLISSTVGVPISSPLAWIAERIDGLEHQLNDVRDRLARL